MPHKDDNTFNILFFGDVSGDAGCRALRFMLDKLKRTYTADMVIVNGENSDKGYGISSESLSMLKQCPIDVITLGNHAFEKDGADRDIENDPMILRPENFIDVPGRGYSVYEINGVKVGCGNIHLRSGINGVVDCPFKTADRIVKNLSKITPIIFIDAHGEDGCEKEALFMYLKGRISALCGTHTHVQTADEKIASGTAYITDVGMCGASLSVIGGDINSSIRKAKECMPVHIEAVQGKAVVMGVCVSVDIQSGKSTNIERIYMHETE